MFKRHKQFTNQENLFKKINNSFIRGVFFNCIMNYQLFLTMITLVEFIRGIHIESYFRDDIQKELINNVRSYDIIQPVRITRSGNFLSNRIIYSVSRDEIDVSDSYLQYQNHYNPNMHPSRSYYHGDQPFYEIYPQQDPTVVHYELMLEGETYIIDMSLNRILISPHLYIQNKEQNQEGDNFNSDSKSEYEKDQCYFLGKIRGLPNSKVALGTCNGLEGLINLGENGKQYYIEPLKENITILNGANLTFKAADEKKIRQKRDNNVIISNHPHLIYKRSSLKMPNFNIQKRETSNLETSNFIDKTVKRSFTKKENVKRRKRSVSILRTIETMVTLDLEFQNYYSKMKYSEDMIRNYVFINLNIASSIFHDVSMGNALEISITRYDLSTSRLKNDHTRSAEEILKSFCEYAKLQNSDTFDFALLITKIDLCSETGCNCVGLAPLSGMCSKDNSCVITEDSGLTLGDTIAHEIGHNLGSTHDGNGNCQPDPIKHNYVMTPLTTNLPGPLIWSSCSKDAITKYLDGNFAECLNISPRKSLFKPDKGYPGLKIDATQQCKYLFGESFTQYIDKNNKDVEKYCKILQCKSETQIVSRSPPQVGTMCSENKWCMKGACVPVILNYVSINGNWGEWGQISECSRTCGGGVQYNERLCNKPMPENGGMFCLGIRKKYQICNTNSCSDNSLSFRDLQCVKKRADPFNGYMYNWEGYISNDSKLTPCKLYCQDKSKNTFSIVKPIVDDGTPCDVDPYSYDRCISGGCQKVGCDWNIDSPSKEDKCGICNGDSSSCNYFTNKYTVTSRTQYQEMVIIPRGAINIKIYEEGPGENFLAVCNQQKQYYLNGVVNNLISVMKPSRNIQAGKSILSYEKSDEQETISIKGPIMEDLVIQIIPGDGKNYPFNYEYSLHKNNQLNGLMNNSPDHMKSSIIQNKATELENATSVLEKNNIKIKQNQEENGPSIEQDVRPIEGNLTEADNIEIIKNGIAVEIESGPEVVITKI